MELVTTVDEQNNKYSYKRYQGYPFNQEFVGNVGDHLDKIAKREIREDDVLVGVFPKSGTHWLYNTVMMLRSGTLGYHGTPTLMDFQDFNIIEQMPSPRTFGAHMRFRFLPEQMKLGKGKVITIIRNPKDVVVSLYHMLEKMEDIGFRGTFERLVNIFVSEECMFGNGSWFSWIKDTEDWQFVTSFVRRLLTGNRLVPVIPNLNLSQNTYANVVKLAKFLEVDHDEEFLRSVSENIQFDKLKESHNKTTPPSDRWKHITEDGRLPIYRKGRIGEWKNIFTVVQSEEFDRIYEEKFEQMGLKFDVQFE